MLCQCGAVKSKSVLFGVCIICCVIHSIEHTQSEYALCNVSGEVVVL